MMAEAVSSWRPAGGRDWKVICSSRVFGAGSPWQLRDRSEIIVRALRDKTRTREKQWKSWVENSGKVWLGTCASPLVLELAWPCCNHWLPEPPLAWCPHNRWSGQFATETWKSQASSWSKHPFSCPCGQGHDRASVLVHSCWRQNRLDHESIWMWFSLLTSTQQNIYLKCI